ncbi:hypothetical protein MAPG_05994 [Magnaporthiopsis poae ATCC 64411]|uniref:Uncharacterized protein n=1 Tax=Magnaporthiopsis poae (strain ATCC 64411 / 73-15) TaxID=644358 RepID=A0A0C4E0V7_MAGP6|nr:hypothetical protein MAPG_05994 [Magnaporthiopsis poae ATCC 64411]
MSQIRGIVKESKEVIRRAQGRKGSCRLGIVILYKQLSALIVQSTVNEGLLAIRRVYRARVAVDDDGNEDNDERQGQQQHKPSVLDGLRQAARDPRTWLFCLMQNMHMSACTFSNFFPSIVRATHFAPDSLGSLLLTAPPYVVSGVVSVVLGWSSGPAARPRLARHGGTGAGHRGVRHGAGLGPRAGTTPEKRAVAYAVVNVSASVAAIYGAFLWPHEHEPRYVLGFSATAAFAAASIVCAWTMRAWLMRLNRRLDEAGRDEEAPQQRYVY